MKIQAGVIVKHPGENLKLENHVFGIDVTDCSTITGVLCGYRKMMNHGNQNKENFQIVDRYKNTTRDNMPDDETITTFADRIIGLF